MKEILKQKLANPSQTPYSKGVPLFNRGGDIFMAEPGQGEKPMGVDEATRRLDIAAKAGEEARRQQASASRFLEEHRDLLVDVRGPLEDIVREGAPSVSSGVQEPRQEQPAAAGAGVPPGGGEPPRAPPFLSETPPEEPNNQNEGQLNPADYDITGVTDPELKRIGGKIKAKLGMGLMGYQEAERIMLEMENVYPSWGPGSPDAAWGRKLYDKLDNERIRLREEAGDINWRKAEAELMAATKGPGTPESPEEIGARLRRIEDIVKHYYDFNERPNVGDLVRVSLSNEAIKGGTYGYALEYVLESIINVADLTPLGTIPNPTFAQSENISRLIKGTLDLDQDINKEFYKYLKDLQEKRQLSHELYKSMSTRGAYEKYVGEHLKNDGFHYLENKIVGVSETQGLWEKVMARKKSAKKQILSQAEFDDIHKQVRRLFKRNANLDASGTSQKLQKRIPINKVDESGETQSLNVERPLREWEINRAAVVGRSVAHVSGRAITYGMLGDLPSINDELFESMNAEYVARITGSMKVSAQRFIAQGSNASKEYIRLWVKNKRQIAEESGLVFGEGDEKEGRSLYGQRLDSAVYLDTGVPDLKSHSWRNRRTQLKNSVFAKIAEHDPNEPAKNTIGDYLDREWIKASTEVDKLAEVLRNGKPDSELTEKAKRKLHLNPDENDYLAKMGLTDEESAYFNDKKAIKISKRDRIKDIKFSRNIRNTVLQQRLYLGAVLREPHFTPMLREEIWKKISEFLPSRIAAFFPEERSDLMQYGRLLTNEERMEFMDFGRLLNDEERKKENKDKIPKLTDQQKEARKELEDNRWEALSDKLFMAEMDRVREQAEKVKDNDFPTEVKLSKFYADNEIITDEEKNYITKIIELGKNKSRVLAIMVFPQNAFLDDAPEPEWMNLGKETVGRLLVNDYEGYNTANNERNAIIGNPSMRPEQSAQHLVKAKDGYASPIGPQEAQDRLEADVLTRYDLYAMNGFSKWGLYSLNRLLKQPTSLIEKSNVDANISMDERAISQDVEFLSQHSVVNNDKARLDFFGHTQSEKIKKKAKARLIDLWMRNLRLLLMLFPLAFSTEFIKMIAPEFKDK